jgi:hypothetical protein
VEEREVVEDLSQRRTTLTFHNNSYEFRLLNMNMGSCGLLPSFRTVKGTYHLDVEQSPKVMERRWEEHGIRDETVVSPST